MPLNWEFTYNGLTFGGNNQIGVTLIQGLEHPESKTDIRPNVGRDGSFVHAAFSTERRVTITGDMFATVSTLEALIDSWRTAFDNQVSDLNLDYKAGTAADRRIKCRPSKRTLTITDYDIGLALWVVELVAADPAIYNTSDVKLFDG